MDLSGPDGPTQTYERALVDRIGFAARQGGGGGLNLALDPNQPPALNDLDVYTLNVLPGRSDPAFPGLIPSELDNISNRLSGLPAAQDQPAPETGAVLRDSQIVMTRALSVSLLAASDAMTSRIARDLLQTAYFDRPRLVLVSRLVTVDTQAQTASSTASIDLRRDSMRP